MVHAVGEVDRFGFLEIRAVELEGDLLTLELGVRDTLGEQCPENLTPRAALLDGNGDVELPHIIEEVEDVPVRSVAKRAQKRCGRELLLLVDVDVYDVVDVERELHPRAAEGDDPGAEQAGAVRVDRLLEHDPRRTVKLADDDPLRAVHHERPLLG